LRQVSILLGFALLLATPAVAQTSGQEPAQTPAQAPDQAPAPAQAPDQTPASGQAPAQTPPKKPAQPLIQEPGQAPRSRLELSAGYTYVNYDQQDNPRLNMSGFNLGADVNVLKWLQVGATLTDDYNRQSSSNIGLNGTRTSLFSFMAGPRIYFRGHHHERSYFFDGLVGVGDIKVRPPYLPPLPNPADKDRVLAWGAGFGLDRALSPRFALRGQVDYVRTGFFGGNPGQSNVVASVSIVYRVPRIKAPPRPKKKPQKSVSGD
jgi:Outer membrane protein beta-barrel domain